MVHPGVYPAAVTPFDDKGRIDRPSVARLLAWFETAGCTGVVLAGTNGEGPSLTTPEKRDLLSDASPLKGKLDLILGIATCSLNEAIWSCKQAHESGAVAALVMPPFYFKEPLEKIQDWFTELLDRSPLPILVYNFPQRTGITLTAEFMAEASAHENCAGLKDSSGNRENLQTFREAVKRQDQVLFVGDETLLIEALQTGWSGTISGATNSIPHWIVEIVKQYLAGDRESAEAKFQLTLPVIEALRKSPQPATHKGILHRQDVLSTPLLRLPLTQADGAAVTQVTDLIKSLTPTI
ncbi:MAG: dihydrodipicolinate synthase family protein [Fimbriimonadaceae bacterium]|nr:dihydrodipicolinate synthase family protein [Fimbriimonadaceae bacterium]